MMKRIVWSLGLYTIDIMVHDDDLGAIQSVIDMPPIFPNGDVKKFVKENYGYDSHMNKGRFQIYIGLEGRNPSYSEKIVTEIANEFNFKFSRIDNVDDLIVKGSRLNELVKSFVNKEFNNNKKF